MVFVKAGPGVMVPNVNIEDCDYTIAFWIRSTQWFLDSHRQTVTISGSSRFGKFLSLYVSETYAKLCREVSTESYVKCVYSYYYSNAVLNNWTLITVTCEQESEVKMFFNGKIANRHGSWRLSGLPSRQTLLPKEFVIDHSNNPVIMDLHILGFALPGDEIYNLYRG